MKILIVGAHKDNLSTFLAWFKFNGVFFHCDPFSENSIHTVFIYPKDKNQLKNCNKYINHCRKYHLM